MQVKARAGGAFAPQDRCDRVSAPRNGATGLGHVLVITGELADPTGLRAGLEALGFTVEACMDDQAGRAAVEAGGADCALIDEAFLRMQGVLYLAQARAKRAAHLPIVLMTSHPEEHATLFETYELDTVDALLPKPFSTADAVRAIRHAMERGRSTGRHDLCKRALLWLRTGESGGP